MTTDCLTDAYYASADRKLHDAVVGVVVAVIFILPASLAAIAFF